ncbi:MAG: alanine racemase [Spirochaetales bacterium]|nr:alanine racemase [Spirochaetales bacterium]
MSVLLSRSALAANIETFRRLCRPARIIAVVKSNAYGHGSEPVVRLLNDLLEPGDSLAVHSVEEARELVPYLRWPLLIMGGTSARHDSLLAVWNATGRTVHTVASTAQDVGRLTEAEIPFHIKVDTGMGRLGAHGEGLEEIFALLQKSPRYFQGIMTHFANVEDVLNQDYALLQLQRFEAAARRARTIRSDILVHAAASAPALILPASRFDAVRTGIGMYGLWPSQETRLSLHSMGVQADLQPVLSWQTQIIHLNRVARGEFIGYGCTYRTLTDSLIAVLPVGYNEGYARALSNRSHVLIRGRRAPVRGRVCMNMIMVDVTHIEDVRSGDIAVLIGSSVEEKVTAEELAELAGTINYEVVTRIHHTQSRRIVD